MSLVKLFTEHSKLYTTLPLTNNPVEIYHTLLKRNQPFLENTLTKNGLLLDSSIIKQVLKKCVFYDKNDLILGLRFFIWAGLQRGEYRHSKYMYGHVLKVLEIRKNPNLIKEVVDKYRDDGCVIGVNKFKVVLNLCRHGVLVDEGMWVLRRMREFGCVPDMVAYNVVIRLLCEVGRVDEARGLLDEMGDVGVFPDMVTFVALVKGFCEKGRVEDASKLFKVVTEKGCELNVVAYSALLDGVCKVGNLDKGLTLLDEMENEGGGCALTVVTYTSVISSFCKRSRTMEALTILDRMEACGCAPNRVTISTFMNGFCKEDKVDEAYKLIDRVADKGSVTKSECYSSLVVTLLRVRKFEEAEKIFRRMLVSGLKPDGVACSELLKRLCLKEQRVLDAFMLYNEIDKLEFATNIDSEIYSIMMDGLCTKRHLLEASKLAKLMGQKSIRLKAPYVKSVVEYLKNAGEMEIVSHIYKVNGG